MPPRGREGTFIGIRPTLIPRPTLATAGEGRDGAGAWKSAIDVSSLPLTVRHRNRTAHVDGYWHTQVQTDIHTSIHPYSILTLTHSQDGKSGRR